MKIAALIGVVAFAGVASADLIISEVVDGPLSGGNPKWVEITNTGNAAVSFGSGGLIIQSNASSDTAVDVDLSGVTIAPGQSYVIASNANGGDTSFFTTYGADADLYTPVFFGNGDDRYIIDLNGSLVDIYGVFGSNASGDLATYNYTDSYAYRLPDAITGSGQTYVAGEWFVPGPDALEVGGSGQWEQNLRDLTTPGTHNYVPAPGAAALLGLGGLAALRRRR